MTDYTQEVDKLLSLLPSGWEVSILGSGYIFDMLENGFRYEEWRITARHNKDKLRFVLVGSEGQHLNDELIRHIANQITKDSDDD